VKYLLYRFSTAAVLIPRNVAIVTVGAAAVAGIAWYALRQPKVTPEELERRRRDLLALTGRITDGNIIDAPLDQDGPADTPRLISYSYRIGGVVYECAQDVTLLADHIDEIRADLPIQVRYDPHNPANSIIVAESWSGLRFSDHPDHQEKFR